MYVNPDLYDSVQKFQEQVHRNAVEHGFWEGEGCSPGEKIALMHQELSELLDNFRDDRAVSSKIAPYTNAEEEIADLIIRVLDFAAHHKLNVAGALLSKHDYNTKRPYKHGRVNY